MDPIHLLWFDWSHVWFDSVYIRARSREGSGKGVRVTGGKLWHRVLQSYTGKSPAAINVLAVLVRVGNQLSRSLPQFMVEYVETRQISFNWHSPSHLKLFSTSRKKHLITWWNFFRSTEFKVWSFQIYSFLQDYFFLARAFCNNTRTLNWNESN